MRCNDSADSSARQRFYKLISGGACLLLFFCANSVAKADQYIIEIYSDDSLNVRGKETLNWRNETGQPIAEIPLIFSGKIKSVSAGNVSLQVKDKKVQLPAPVQSGATVSLQIEFEKKAKKGFGYRMLVNEWHPKAIVFRNGRFNQNQRQCDDYEVVLTAPASLIIAAAGELIEKSQASEGQQRYRWHFNNATSFGLAASPNFVETRKISEGVEIRFFKFLDDNRFDPVIADYAVDVVAFYKKLFGFYPHPAIVLLPGDFRFGGGGILASGMAVFYKNTGEYYLRQITAHEIGHQYWGFDTVVDDGDYVHWPGFPLGMYSDQLYTQTYYPDKKWETGTYTKAAAKGFDTTIRRSHEEMKSLKYEWNMAICHYKAFRVIRMLEDLMGKERFFSLVQRLLERYRYRYLSFDAFQKEAEEVSGQKLDWFFNDWLNTSKTARFEVEDVQKQDESVQVRIRRLGDARFPIEVRLTLEDGTQFTKRIAYEPEIQILEFAASGNPKSIELDPRWICTLVKVGQTQQSQRVWLQSTKP
jgi:hypothetical protein